jgi:EmrB/QacA subfamily drug resistance transporter
MIRLGSRRWWALAALVLSVLTVSLDATVLNVALPTLATSLHASTGALQWMVDAYILVFAGLLLPAGALGDRYGRKRLLLLGLAFFGAASAAATHAGSTGQLIAARAVMGIGAAVLMPVVVAVLPVIFPPDERAKAVAFGSIGMGLGLPLGPIVGGYLLKHFWWGSVFAINVPVATLAMVAVAILIPESRDPAPRGADVVGAGLSTLGLVTLVYGLIEAPDRGWGDAVVLGATALGLLLLTAFTVWERHTAAPMIDLALFGRRRFLWGTLSMTVASFTLFGLLFVLPQYFQAVRGSDALGTGVRLLPLIGGLVVGARASATVATRVGQRIPISAGLVLIAGGLAVGASTAAGSGYALAAAWLSVVGTGAGLVLAPAMDAVLGELPVERAGAGSAVTMTVRQVGGALGVALLGSVSASAYTDRLVVAGLPDSAARIARDSVNAAVALADRLSDPALAASARTAYLHAMDVVLACCAVVALAGAAFVAMFMPARSTPPLPSDAPDHEAVTVA